MPYSSIENRRKYQKDRRKAGKMWQDLHPIKAYRYNQKYRRKLRQDVVNMYGGMCVCCNEKEIGFLTLDHKKQDGHKDLDAWNLYRWHIKTGKTRRDLQVLCMNCNWAMRYKRRCPHSAQTK